MKINCLQKIDGDKTVIVFPQGFRDAEFMANSSLNKIPAGFSSLFLDGFGRGGTKEQRWGMSTEEISEMYYQLLKKKCPDFSNSIVFCKSLSASLALNFVEYVERKGTRFKGLLIVTGPVFGRRQAIVVRLISMLAIYFPLFRIITDILIKFFYRQLRIDFFAYCNFRSRSPWLDLLLIAKSRMAGIPETHSPAIVIQNKKDEIVSELTLDELVEKTNVVKFIRQNSTTHFGESMKPEEMQYIADSLVELAK